MRCPYCGDEMIKGTFRSRGGNYFLPDGEKTPILCTAKSMQKRNAIQLPPSLLNLGNDIDWPVAYACRSCRKIILDY